MSVLVLLLDRVIWRGDSLSFAWLVVGEEYGEDGLMSWVFYVG